MKSNYTISMNDVGSNIVDQFLNVINHSRYEAARVEMIPVAIVLNLNDFHSIKKAMTQDERFSPSGPACGLFTPRHLNFTLAGVEFFPSEIVPEGRAFVSYAARAELGSKFK